MSDPHERSAPPQPQGTFLRLPYDWRRPSRQRIRQHLWNPGNLHLLVPKTFGWGYEANLYWIAHPVRFIRARRGE